MPKYTFDENLRKYLESLRTPMVVYQFIDKRVVPILITAGFRDLFEFKDLDDAYYVMNTDMYSTAHPDDAARIADAAYRFATEQAGFDVVYRMGTRSGGAYKMIHAIGEHVYLDSGERLAYCWYMDEGSYASGGEDRDVGLGDDFRRALREESMVHQSYFDSLTGMPNMTCFFDLAETGRKRLIEEGSFAAFLFIDLCGMKLFNNKHGFAEGDKLLRAFSKLLVKYFSNENCGRFGQDHFAVYTDAKGLDDKIKVVFKEAEGLNDGKSLPIRVGVYIDKTGNDSASHACDLASYACDKLKGGYGSEYKYYDESMLSDAVDKRYVVENIDRAIKEKWVQVYYQPIIRAANGRVCDEEALARWIDPVKGFMSPAQFIPALEEAKQIYKLDLYVVDTIIEKFKTQSAAGIFLVPVSVNLSRHDFEACDIVEEIRRRVDESGLDRELLTIEVTESVIGSDFEFMKQQVDRFRELGFRVWMDDFGSGYSSLDVLQSIKFDVIKLDMRFMQNFESGEETRIILTELIKLAIGLGMDTVCEGVETIDQVEFLREVGCTKLQGFYFSKPLPLREIFKRYESGISIGFENHDETDYYAAIGRINLYDASVIAQGDSEPFKHYFNAIPMAIMETNDKTFKLIRCNSSYRSFMEKMFGVTVLGREMEYSYVNGMKGAGFINALRHCGDDGVRTVIDEELNDGSKAHAFIKRVAVNPVTGNAAVAVAVLSIMENKEHDAVSYAHIAKALSSDYSVLFYVNLSTETFSEFSSDPELGELAVERRGEDFFNASRRDAQHVLFAPDVDDFVKAFTKENVVKSLDETGTFSLTYRHYNNGQPVYMNMKAVRMDRGDEHIIIGVSNVDAQMKHKEALERIRAERVTYARIMALAGDYICIYTVDPVTGNYNEYSTTTAYDGLKLAKDGERFFEVAREECERTLHPEDVEQFKTQFTRENVLGEIEKNGLFAIQYRLSINGEPVYVNLKAALVSEKDGDKLIVGINNVDAQVKREQEYAMKLSQARAKSGVDAVTGVKNHRAFLDAEEALEKSIDEDANLRFAIVLFDMKGMADINESKGYAGGNQYLKKACGIICEVFKHSPVFRMVDDEFAVIAMGRDYRELDTLLERIRNAEDIENVHMYFSAVRYDGTGDAASVYYKAVNELKNKKKAK